MKGSSEAADVSSWPNPKSHSYSSAHAQSRPLRGYTGQQSSQRVNAAQATGEACTFSTSQTCPSARPGSSKGSPKTTSPPPSQAHHPSWPRTELLSTLIFPDFYHLHQQSFSVFFFQSHSTHVVCLTQFGP